MCFLMKKFFITITLFSVGVVFAQKIQVQRAAIAFYNVENLWDTVPSADYIDGTKDVKNPAFHRSVPLDSLQYLQTTEVYKGEWSDELLTGKKVVRNQILADDFTANSSKNWNTEKYNQKMANVSKVLSELGRQYTNDNPAIIGLVEVENRQVIADLIKQPALAKSNYGIVHHNSYDARGVDVALIYQKGRFVVTDHYEKEIKVFNDDGYRSYTRGILVVKGLLDGEKYAFFVNHWPSRRGGEAASLPKRNAAAAILKKEMDSVKSLDPSTKLFAMGDFNDDPISPSLKNYLKAVGNPKDLNEENHYLNLMYPLYKKGVASLAYQDAPNLFDQIIVSSNLYSPNNELRKDYSIFKAEVFAPAYLVNKEGNYKGYPFRSWNGDQFTGGYSDHFPAFVVLQKEP